MERKYNDSRICFLTTRKRLTPAGIALSRPGSRTSSDSQLSNSKARSTRIEALKTVAYGLSTSIDVVL